MGQDPEANHPTGLTTQPSNPAGWNIPPALRCSTAGHEVDPLIEYMSGVLVGYCRRCNARFEAPWVRGGTAVALAKTVAGEVAAMELPAVDVLTQLDELLALLEQDAGEVDRAINLIRTARLLALHRLQ